VNSQFYAWQVPPGRSLAGGHRLSCRRILHLGKAHRGECHGRIGGPAKPRGRVFYWEHWDMI